MSRTRVATFAVSERNPESMSQHLKKGEELLQAGQVEDALRCFELALEQQPDDHRAVYFAALAELKLDREAMALVGFNRALQLDPDNVNYLADLAVTKVRLDDSEGAMRDLDRCVALDPGYSYRYSLRAFVRNGMGDVLGAIEDYRKAVELDPEDVIALNNLGMAEEKLGYTGSAQQRFEKADRLSGVNERGSDHTIAWKDRKKEVDAAPSAPSAGTGVRGYWDTVGRLLTDAGERKEFLAFARNLLTPGK